MVAYSFNIINYMHSFLKHIDVPIAFLMLGVGILLSIITRFPQVRNFKKFY